MFVCFQYCSPCQYLGRRWPTDSLLLCFWSVKWKVYSWLLTRQQRSSLKHLQKMIFQLCDLMLFLYKKGSKLLALIVLGSTPGTREDVQNPRVFMIKCPSVSVVCCRGIKNVSIMSHLSDLISRTKIDGAKWMKRSKVISSGRKYQVFKRQWGGFFMFGMQNLVSYT